MSCIVADMRSAPTIIVALACMALLVVQFSGLHLHASSADHEMDVHAAVMPAHDADGHEHTAHSQIDVSLTDAAVLKDAKIKLPFIAALLFAALFLSVVLQRLPRAPRYLAGLSRKARWRPPLRAPPVLS